MKIIKVLKFLGIEDYKDRIINSNSHGELSHLLDYYSIAEYLKNEDVSWFRPWFDGVVKQAEESWERPESVFQHILRILKNYANYVSSLSNQNKEV